MPDAAADTLESHTPAPVTEAPISDEQIAAAAIFEQIAEKRSLPPAAPPTDRQWKTAALREALRP